MFTSSTIPLKLEHQINQELLIKIITKLKMATNQRKRDQKNSNCDPDTDRSCGLGWNPPSSLYTPTQSSSYTRGTQWEGGPVSVAHEPHARPRTWKQSTSTLYSFWSTTINFSIYMSYTTNESWILILINYYRLSSSTYANYQVSLSSNGVWIKKYHHIPNLQNLKFLYF